MDELNDPKKLRGIVDVIAKGAKQNFLRDGHLLSAAVVLATCDPETGNPLPNLGIFTMSIGVSSPDQKDAMADALAQAVKKMKPIMLVQIHEAWMVRTDEDKVGNAVELATKSRLSEHPNRIEVIRVSAESKQFPDGGFELQSEIQRSPGKVTLTEWKQITLGVGRFARFL